MTREHERAVAEFLKKKAQEDPDKYREISAATPLREATFADSDNVGAGTELDAKPTPTRAVPEHEWAKTDEARAWYLKTKKRMSYTQVAREMRLAVGSVKSMVNRAKKNLDEFRADPGWLGWSELMTYVRDQHDPQPLTEEDELGPEDTGLTYAHCRRS